MVMGVLILHSAACRHLLHAQDVLAGGRAHGAAESSNRAGERAQEDAPDATAATAGAVDIDGGVDGFPGAPMPFASAPPLPPGCPPPPPARGSRRPGRRCPPGHRW
jgi:hypothetical protein